MQTACYQWQCPLVDKMPAQGLYVLLAVVAAQLRPGSSSCGNEMVFEHEGPLQLDGKTCALRSAGAAAALPMGSSPYTLQADIQTNIGAVDDKSVAIMSWGDFTGSSVNAFRLDYKGEGLQNYWFGNDLATPASTQLHLADGKLHRVAAIWDGTTQSIVADGKEVASRKPPSPLKVVTKQNFCVGSASDLYDAKFDGQIMRIRIWSVALTVPELDRECGSWGVGVLWILGLGSGLYIGAGLLYARRHGAAATRDASGVMQMHPHWKHWIELRGLAQDGVRFSLQQQGGARRIHHGQPAGKNAGSSSEGLLRSSVGTSAVKDIRSLKKSGKSAKHKHGSKKDTRGSLIGKAEQRSELSSGGGGRWTGNTAAAALAEQKLEDSQLHPSQHKITVVAIT